MKKILITGGSGLVGKALTKKLLKSGSKVVWLSRMKKQNAIVPTYHWNPQEQFIDEKAFEGVTHIVHLAGANVAGKRWTKFYKQEIADSRIATAQLLFEYTKRLQLPLEAFISASATGYYGTFTSEQILTEKSPSGSDFLAKVCIAWESKAQQFTQKLDIRHVCLRTGIVLSNEGGALPKMTQPIKLGFGAVLGSGKQYMPFIDIDDLVNLYILAIENNEMQGSYNATSPQQITNREFTLKIAKQLGKRIWLPNIPTCFIKLLFGEQAIIMLEGSHVIPERLQKDMVKKIQC